MILSEVCMNRILLVVVLMVAGCAKDRIVPISGPDYTYASKRYELKNEPVPYPKLTPYDGEKVLQTAFLEGFKAGWEIAIKYWLGNLVAVPEAYQNPPAVLAAWSEGCNAGQKTLCERVLGRQMQGAAPE
jgi:hypothetical protein